MEVVHRAQEGGGGVLERHGLRCANQHDAVDCVHHRYCLVEVEEQAAQEKIRRARDMCAAANSHKRL